MKKRVFVGMSGGVDSSVAAWLLKKRGYDVTGVFLRCFNLDGCAEKDSEDARRTAAYLNIPFYVFDLEKEYKDKVVEYMVGGYRRGLTPNPDVMCNKEIKFGLFLEKALVLGADYVATGHYVRFGRDGNFLAGKDLNKDQSYFLWTLTRKQLKHCLFPIGDYLKSEVRAMARRAGLPTAAKKDSQGICFLGNISMMDFLKSRLPIKSGKVIDVSGKTIGEHEGICFYTVGQRHIGIKNYKSEAKGNQEMKPLYVAAKNLKNNVLMVAEGGDNPALYQKEIKLAETNFIDPTFLSSVRTAGGKMILARVRYRQPLAEAILRKRRDGEVRLIFEKPQKFVARGQSAVFYEPIGRNLAMRGGGVII